MVDRGEKVRLTAFTATVVPNRECLVIPALDKRDFRLFSAARSLVRFCMGAYIYFNDEESTKYRRNALELDLDQDLVL